MSATPQSNNEKILDDTKLEGGVPLENALTYGHDREHELDGPTTVADERRTKAILRKVSEIAKG